MIQRYCKNSYNINTDVEAFYKYFRSSIQNGEFDKITYERSLELKSLTNTIEARPVMDRKLCQGIRRYANLMNHIRTNTKKYELKSIAEIYILFMLIIDPDFEALMICEEYLDTNKIKLALIDKFGFYDLNLVRIEKLYLQKIMAPDDKKVLMKKIDERVWK